MSLDAKNTSDLSIIGELSGHVAAHSRSAIVHCLAKIKSDGKILDQFVKDGGINILIKLLKSQSSRVLDITLSVLGNAFIKCNIKDEVCPRTITCNVIWIVKNLTSGSSLHCRACRLIGNMAKSINHAKALCEAHVIPALGEIINSKPNTQTQTMAIRAIRNIWITYEQSHNDILDSGLIKEITMLLVSYKDRTRSKYKELADACLKAIRAFADTLDKRSGEQIRIKDDLIGYKCIIDYCKLNNRMSFKILNKLCQVADHRPKLGIIGAIECIIRFIESEQFNNLSYSFTGDVVTSLCLFSREAVNRSRIRDGGGLEIMLKLLADSQNEMYQPVLLQALTDFIYDECSIAIIIKNGIVNVLVRSLKRMTVDCQSSICDKNFINITSRKRTADNILSPNKMNNFNPIKYGRYSLDSHINDWCSRNINNISSSSSPSNSSSTQYCTVDGANDDYENYNPVNNITKNDMILYHKSTLELFEKLTKWNHPIEGLAHPTTIEALTSYTEISKSTRALQILNRIIQNHVYFLPLLLQGFVFDAQLLENANDYLKILCITANSGVAFGELATILLRGNQPYKLIVAISVPFLLRSKDKLRVLLNDHGGLELIFSLLIDDKHHLNKNSILSICQLANALGIVPETTAQRSITNDNSHDDNNIMNNYDDKNNDGNKTKRIVMVTFELDDGETVDVSRKLLCIKSKVFRAMLEGEFYESGKNKIQLRNVSREGFKMLCLTASDRLLNNNDLKIEAILDGVLLADRFLMIDEFDKLTETSMSQLSHRNLCRAWNWARLNYCQELKICCVKNFLTLNLSRDDRISAFCDFSANENFQEFLDDVKDIVTSELSIRP